jgi:hypothetical protein
MCTGVRNQLYVWLSLELNHIHIPALAEAQAATPDALSPLLPLIGLRAPATEGRSPGCRAIALKMDIHMSSPVSLLVHWSNAESQSSYDGTPDLTGW